MWITDFFRFINVDGDRIKDVDISKISEREDNDINRENAGFGLQ